MERRNMVLFRITLLLLAGLGSRVAAQTTNSKSWESVRSLTPGRPVEVIERRSAAIKGELSSVSADSLTVSVKHRAIVLLRSEVSTVRVRSGKRRRYALIGAAIGAGAGLGLGVAGSESLSNGGGGDLTNLKPAITLGSGALGALIGAVIGSVVGNRGNTVYHAKWRDGMERAAFETR
jgi:hypothetical protein